MAITRENILKIKRVMFALHQIGSGIQTGNARSKFIDARVLSRCATGHLGEKDHVCPYQMRWRLAQNSSGQQMPVAKRLLGINQHHIRPASPQLPILEAVVEKQSVTAKLFDGKASGLDPVFIDQDHDIPKIRRQHVRFITGTFGVE